MEEQEEERKVKKSRWQGSSRRRRKETRRKRRRNKKETGGERVQEEEGGTGRGGERGGEVPFLRWRAVWHLAQDDDTSALGEPDLLSTGRHLEVRQCWWPSRRDIEDERVLTTLIWYEKKKSKVLNSHLTMSEISSRSVLMFLTLSKLARVWMDTYWSPSI